MPTRIRLRGVPHVFGSYSSLVTFLKASPGYRDRQRKYLERFWPGALSEAEGARVRATATPRELRAKAAGGKRLFTKGDIGKVKPIPAGYTPTAVADDAKTEKRLQRARNRERAKYLRAQRALGSLNPLEKAIRDVAFMPAGIYYAGQATAHDIGKGKLTLPETRAYWKEVAKQTGESFLHPGRDPFITGLNLWGGIGAIGGTAARLGAFGSALAKEGSLGSALFRPGYKGGSLFRSPHPGRYELTVGEGSVKVPLSQNPAWRQVQRGRLKAAQRTLDKGWQGEGRAVPKHAVWVPKNLSSAGSFGRQIRASRRIEFDLRRAPLMEVEKDLSWLGKRVELPHGRFAIKSDPARNNAVSAVAIFGDEALHNPAGVVAKMRVKHEELRAQIASEFQNPKLTRNRRAELNLELKAQNQIIETLPAVQLILEQQAPEFLRAVDAARRLSHETEGELGNMSLDASRASRRIANMRALYEGAQYNVDTLAAKIDQGAPIESFIGKQVVPHDRDNIGTIAEIDPENHIALVKFFNKSTNARGEAYIGLDEMHLRGDRSGKFSITIDAPPEGSFYFPMREEYVNTVQPMAGTSSAGGGFRSLQTGIAEPGAFAGLSQKFTGASLRKGLPQLHQALPDRFLRVQRLRDSYDFYSDLTSYATDVKVSPWDVPLRLDRETLPELRRIISDAQRHYELNPDLAGKVPDTILNRINDLLNPKGIGEVPIGTELEGVKWVDGRFIKHITGINPQKHQWAQAFDAINNPLRITTLYLRPAYLLNALGNAGMALVTQGYMAPKFISLALASKRVYGPEALAQLKAVGGEGRSLAYSVETGFAHRTSQRLAWGWNKVTDEWFRISSVLHAAERQGYKGKDGIAELFRRDETGHYVHVDDLVEIGRRARQDAVDFNSLTPFERDVMRHLVYFYPWISRGSIWAGRALKEHPIKSAVLGNVGAQGSEQAAEWFGGKTPHWMERSGIFPIEKAFGGRVPVKNPSSVWTPTTLSQSIEDAINLGKGIVGAPHGEFGGFTPALESFITSATNADTGHRAGGLLGALESTPQVAALSRSGLDIPGVPEGPASYPDRGTQEALGPLAWGGLYTRSADTAVLREQAGIGSTERVLLNQTNWLKRAYEQATNYGLIDPKQKHLPRKLREAVKHRTGRYAAYKGAGLKQNDPEYQQKAFRLDVSTLLRRGAITQAQARKARKWAEGANKADLEKERYRLTDKYFGGKAIRDARYKITRAAFKTDVEKLLAEAKITHEQAAAAMSWANGASVEAIAAEHKRIAEKYGIPDFEPALGELR